MSECVAVKSHGSRLPELDWIRAISALFVMLYHYTAIYGVQVGWCYAVNRGWGAVSAFYLLSGFLIVLALKKDTTATGFISKRCRRLYPTYWTCMLVTALLMELFYQPLASDRETIVINLTYLQWLANAENVDGAYWTMQYEFRFYAFVAILLLIRQHRHIKWYTLLWVAISFVLMHYQHMGVTRRLVRIPVFWLMPENCAPFASGVFLAHLYKNRKDIVSWIGLACALGLCLFAQTDGHIIGHMTAAAVVLAMSLLRQSQRCKDRYVAAVDRLHCGPLRFLGWLAAISYPFYLHHQNIGWSILYGLDGIGLNAECTIAIPIAVVVCMAWLVHHFVEKPCAAK